VDWKQDLAQTLADIRGFSDHQDLQQLHDAFQVAKAIMSERALCGDIMTMQKTLKDIDRVIHKTNWWPAVHRKSFMSLYALAFIPHHSTVENMVSLPREVDARIVEGFRNNPEQFNEKNVESYFASLIARKRHDLTVELIDVMLNTAEVSYDEQGRHRANPAHMLPDFLLKIEWQDLKPDKMAAYVQVFSRHEDLIASAIEQTDEETLCERWARYSFSPMIAALYEQGVRVMAEQLFHAHCTFNAANGVIQSVLASGQKPNIETCEQNAEWAANNIRPTYLLAMLELHLASNGQVPLFVDMGSRLLQPFGKEIGRIICLYGQQYPDLAGTIATVFLEKCPNANGFFANPLPPAVVAQHPSLLEASLQSDLGL
jgi:hypothetical protein